LAAIGSAVGEANATAANATTSLLTAAADEVSTRIAALFGAYGLEYQAASAQVAQFGERAVVELAASANAYLTAEIANAAETLGNAVTAPVRTLLWRAPAGSVSAPLTPAGTRITIPGAGPLYYPRSITELPYLGQVLLQGGISGPSSVSILQGYDLQNQAIGQNWFPGTLAEVVNYPASNGLPSGSLFAPGTNDAVALGRLLLHDQITNAVANANGSSVHIAALSQGTIVANRELAYLATNPNAPPANTLQFALFSSPELGLAATYLPAGTTVPVINYTVQPLAVSQYDVSVVYGQYDFFGHPPDRPWNLPAVVNSVFGTAYQHNTAAMASMSDAVELSSVTNSLGGTVTTYVISSPTLPILMPLESIGVPQPIVNNLNAILQPIVNDGYSSLAPNAGPHFSGGALVGLPTAADVVTSLQRLLW
jgi:hypothetical protein